MAGISFCIPALNEEKLIGSCIELIQKEIITTGVHAEIIVVDNGSTDNTALQATARGCKVVLEPQRGLMFAKQSGASEAVFPLIAFIDADSRLRRGWVLRALSGFDDPNVVAVSGPYRYFDVSWFGGFLADAVFALYWAISGIMPCMMGGNSVLRRDVLEHIGGFDTSIKFWGEDTWTAIAYSKYGKVKFDIRLSVDSSGRRLEGQGYVKTFLAYLYNSFAVRLTGNAAMQEHKAFR